MTDFFYPDNFKPIEELIGTFQAPNHPNQDDTDDMAIDGSTPLDFEFRPTSGVWKLTTIDVVIGCSDTPVHDGFGGSANPLTNGLKFEYQTDGLAVKNLLSVPSTTIAKNIELTILFKQDRVIGVGGAGPSEWFTDANGKLFLGTNNLQGIILNAAKNDFMRIVVQDNLTLFDILFLNMGFRAHRSLI